MKHYTVRELAKVAEVSVRTLHYYDEIGLLRPAKRSEAGYRIYGEQELLKLQQILFYRELDVPLEEIQTIVHNPRFNKVNALKSHKKMLQKEIDRLQRLQQTIDKTLRHIKGEKPMLADEELYEGFSKDQATRYALEARKSYGKDFVEKTERRIRKMSKDKWALVRAEGVQIAKDLAAYVDIAPQDDVVQAIIKRHHDWIENFYPAPRDLYRGLGTMYTQSPEFRAYYDAHKPGLTDFLKKAMDYFCDHSL